ncbi:DUF523 domain-containing protein [Campylobacter sp. faydin G-24]|uniref:DUF523 domain-containing protein n=1 Tax=Campylobacter anatolicus TaxID=2829105 RepID=A0ABS5HIM6_9BACT|nr:DUF523 domain-containing protein [Campylobacter anatolicus]MBR8464126.1 DUF523 domain-containing protein [Campylobacter anatolicus]
MSKNENFTGESVLVSACLLGFNCKYNGSNNSNDKLNQKLKALSRFYTLVPVCPEELGGLNTPREPAEIVVMNLKNNQQDEKSYKVMTKFSQTDVTAEFELGANMCVKIASKMSCKIAILKERSPSCGSGQIYDGTFSNILKSGNGLATRALNKIGIKIYGESEIDMLLESLVE